MDSSTSKMVEECWRIQQKAALSLYFRALSRNVTSHLNHRFSAEALLLYSWSDDAYFGQSWNLQAFRSECTTIVCFALHCRLWRVMTTASHVTECHNLIWICIISCHVMSWLFSVLLQPFLGVMVSQGLIKFMDDPALLEAVLAAAVLLREAGSWV